MIKHEKFKVSLVQKNIVYVKIRKEKNIDFDDYKKIKKVVLSLAARLDFYQIIHLGKNTLLDQQMLKSYVEETSVDKLKAEAFVVKTLAQRMILRQIVKDKRKRIPIKVFKNPEQAMIWLENIKNQSSAMTA